MRKSLVVLLLPLALLIQSRAQGRLDVEPGNATAQVAPDHKLYQFFFMRHASLASRAAEKERQGVDGAHLRRLLANRAGLNSSEAAILDQVAQDALREAREVDQKARQIMQATKDKYFPLPPPLPPEIAALQAERDAVFQDARQKLQTALGSNFEKLDTYVKATVHVRGRSVDKR